MIFECNRCHKNFSKKYNYDKHLGRKIQCNIEEEIKIDQDLYKKSEEEEEDNLLSLLDNKVIKNYPLLSNKDNKLSCQIIDDNSLKCLLCDRLYKHLSGLCKHKKQNIQIIKMKY